MLAPHTLSLIFISRVGSGDSSVVRVPVSWSKGRGFEFRQELGRFFLSPLQSLYSPRCLLLRYLFHSRVTAVARNGCLSSCQKCKWQVTAKRACTLRIRLYIKRRDLVHGCNVCTERAETAAVPCGTSHVTTKQRCKYTTSVDSQKTRYKKAAVTRLESHATKAQLIC